MRAARPQAVTQLRLRAQSKALAAHAESLRWTVRVDRFSRKSAPNTYQSELVACKQGGATLELTYRFPGTGKVVRDELAIFREAYPFPEEAKVSIEGDLLIPLDLASELPYWMPLSSSSPLKEPLYWSREENCAVAMAFGMLAWTAHESQRLNQAHARGVWFEQKGDDLYGTIYLHAAEACPRVADDEPEHVIDRRIFQLVFQPLSVCIDVHDLDYKPMGSLLLRFEGGVVQKFDIILNMLMRKQHFDPSLLAHRFPLAVASLPTAPRSTLQSCGPFSKSSWMAPTFLTSLPTPTALHFLCCAARAVRCGYGAVIIAVTGSALMSRITTRRRSWNPVRMQIS